MALNCVILEDTPNSSQLLESFIYKTSALHMNGVYQDFDSLETALKKNAISLLFLVVKQLDSQHFDFLNSLAERPTIIVHSANASLALEAYKLQAVDFLEAPIQVEAFNEAIQKAITARVINLNEKNKLENILKQKYFFVKADYKIIKITIDDILFIEGMGEYIRIYTNQEKIVTLMSLTKMVETLPEHQFIRIHRSYIINIDKVNFVQNNVVSIGEHQLPVSKSQKKTFIRFIDSIGLLN